MPNESRQAFGVERVPLHDSLNKSPEEDDDLVGLRVDLLRLRTQDTMPASVDVILSIRGSFEGNQPSYYVAQHETELDYDFGHESKLVELPPSCCATREANTVHSGMLHRSKRMILGFGRRRTRGVSGEVPTTSQGSIRPQRMRSHSSPAPPSMEVTHQMGIEFRVLLDDGKKQICVGECMYSVTEVSDQALWLPIITKQGHLHSGLQVTLSLLNENQWHQYKLERSLITAPADEPVGMVEEDENFVNEVIFDRVDEDEDEDEGSAMDEPPIEQLQRSRHFGMRRHTRRLHTQAPLETTALSDTDTLPHGALSSQLVRRKHRMRLGLARRQQRHYSAIHTAGQLGLDTHGVQGIITMEVVSARDLPRWRNMTYTSFDMDPFVVVSFHRKVFRTRVCRHTLNPEWREKLYVHVHSRETSYNVRFAVYDWDNMSSNDYVGEVSLEIRMLMEAAEKGSGKVALDLPLEREGHDEDAKFGVGKPRPTLQLEAAYQSYSALRRQFWREMLRLYDTNESGSIDMDELHTMLMSLGSSLTPTTLAGFFERFGKNPYVDGLTLDEGVRALEEELEKSWAHRCDPETADDTDDAVDVERVIQLRECPWCHMPYLSHANESDVVTHLALCSSQEGRAVDDFMVSNFVTATQARRKWYTNMFKTMSQGVYQIGANSANILVQDRLTGQLVEEKMQVYVRLGIRLLYQGAKSRMEGARARRILRNMTIKQGAKYDQPSSVRAIKPFVMFHNIDEHEMVDALDSFTTFNEFFCRRIDMSLRPLAEPDNSACLVSCADCRLMAFENVDQATKLWIKGRHFSIARLLGSNISHEQFALLIFRLAPQDYHRFHAPVDGVVGPPKWLEGEYYTVNPMAIRSAIDVYGENTRVVIPITTHDFGTVYLVAIGAMMVGSIVMTAQQGQHVQRNDELGYFKFGGSTLVLLVDAARVQWDDDLLVNSDACIETLVRVGMRMGHARTLPDSVGEETRPR